jgi:Tol biopolymer transport system component
MTNITLVRKAVRGACALLFLLAAGAPARAQTAQEQFGRVRIQYRDFHWQQYSTQNFTVMFYDGNEPAARRAVDYAEKELQRVTALIGYYPYAKTTIMLYNSVGDLRQSNVGLDPNPETVAGGDAPLARMSKVQIAFTGLQTDFKREISFQLTQVLLNDMMYGGSLREVLQSSYLLQLPDWFISGAAAYAAEGWSVDMDGYMRDMTRLYPTGNRSAPFFIRDPRLSGHSIWNYIAERYGYTSIQNILNLTRITRDAEVGISSSLNVPYKIFMRDWLAYYRSLNAQPATAALALPDAKFQIGGRNRRATIYSQPVFSPNGQQLAYAVNELGRYRVVVARRDGSHRNTVARGGYRTPDQQVENRLPVLAWRGNTQVAVAEMAQGAMTLHLRDATGNNMLDRLRTLITFRRPTSLFSSYDQVLSMNYSADGKSLVFSAVRGGQNDLYVLRAGSRQAEQLTNDLFDDAQPVFMPDGKSIAFSSNRYLDSLGQSRPATFPNVVNNYDLFLYHLDGRTVPVEILASTISNETRPRAVSDDQILYLGEESGVRGLYRYTLSTKQRDRLTSFLPNISDFDYSPTTTALAMVAPAQARDVLYAYPKFELPAGLPAAKTARQQTLEDRSAAPVAAAAKAAARAAGASDPPRPPQIHRRGGHQQLCVRGRRAGAARGARCPPSREQGAA